MGSQAAYAAINNPQMNANLEAWYLSYLQQHYHPSSDAQLAAMYNGGPGGYTSPAAQSYGSAVAKSEQEITVILKSKQGKELARTRTTIHSGHDPHRQPRGQSHRRAQQHPPRPHHSHHTSPPPVYPVPGL